MLPVKKKLYVGDTWRRSWRLKRKTTGAVIDLTGATASLTLHDNKKALIFTATTAGGEMVIDIATGTVSLEISDSQTGQWLPGSYSFRFKVEYPAGQSITYESAGLLLLA